MVNLVVLGFAAVLLFFLFRILNLTDSPRVPLIFASKSSFVNEVLLLCPILSERYRPPLIWGKNGHLQTFASALFGRKSCPLLTGTLHSTQLADGTIVTYEIFESDESSLSSNDQEEQLTVLVVPGIANCTETKYVRTFTAYAVQHGFRVAVLNHLGAKKKEKLTTPRIFTYGGTEEFAAVVKHVTSVLSHKRLVGVGFSMGANILIKYLGEEPSRQKYFECGISVCQGYDILRAKAFLHDWNGLRRFYNWGVTRNMKSVIDRHVKVLFHGPNFTSPKHKSSIHHVRSTSSLAELDDVFIKKMAGFNHLDEFYAVNSSCNYINQIKIPVLMLNALDDPLIPQELFVTPHNHVKCNESALFVVTYHGGHLGFFEGGVLDVSPLTWMDRALIQYIKAVITVKQSSEHSSLSNEAETCVIAS